jgi:preprotein translocase subunit YajC
MTDSPLELTGKPLAEVVATFNREGFTGTLAAFAGGVERFFLFVEGELRASRSSAEQEKLGSWLVRCGHLSKEQKSELLQDLKSSGAPSFGHLVVGNEIIDQPTLDQRLQELAVEIIKRAAAESTPEISYYDGHEGPLPWDTLPDLGTPQVVLEIAREQPDQRAKQEAVGALGQVLVATKKLDDLYMEFNLQPNEAFLLSRLDGRMSIRDAAISCGLPEETAVAVIYALKTAGLVGPREAVADGPPPDTGKAEPAVEVPSYTRSEQEEREQITGLAAQVMSMDHYQALGIEPDADSNAIRRGWASRQNAFQPRRARLRHLRDLEEELAAIYERAESAYEVLSAPALRQRYDHIRRSLTEADSLEQARQQKRQAQARQELVEANLRRADELIRHGEIYTAIELLESALEIRPEAETLLKLGRLLATRPKLVRRALDTFRQAVDLDPGCVEAWLEVAKIWRQRGREERVRKALERALAADPHCEPARQQYQQTFGEKQLARVLRRVQY